MSASQSRQDLCVFVMPRPGKGKASKMKREKKKSGTTVAWYSRSCAYFQTKEETIFRVSFLLFHLVVFLTETVHVQGSGNTASGTMEEAAHLCEIFADVFCSAA